MGIHINPTLCIVTLSCANLIWDSHFRCTETNASANSFYILPLEVFIGMELELPFSQAQEGQVVHGLLLLR